jgi:hypothetical protein
MKVISAIQSLIEIYKDNLNEEIIIDWVDREVFDNEAYPVTKETWDLVCYREWHNDGAIDLDYIRIIISEIKENDNE